MVIQIWAAFSLFEKKKIRIFFFLKTWVVTTKQKNIWFEAWILKLVYNKLVSWFIPSCLILADIDD